MKTPSFRGSAKFNCYYFGVLVFGPALLVSLIFAFTPSKPVDESITKIEQVEEFLALEAQTKGEVKVEEQE